MTRRGTAALLVAAILVSAAGCDAPLVGQDLADSTEEAEFLYLRAAYDRYRNRLEINRLESELCRLRNSAFQRDCRERRRLANQSGAQESLRASLYELQSEVGDDCRMALAPVINAVSTEGNPSPPTLRAVDVCRAEAEG